MSEQLEHTAANEPEETIYKYIGNITGWDNIDIQKVTDVKPVDVINNTFPHDNKNMLISNDFEKLIIIPEKKSRVKKEPKAKPKPKKEPKQKAKSTVIISNDPADTRLEIN